MVLNVQIPSFLILSLFDHTMQQVSYNGPWNTLAPTASAIRINLVNAENDNPRYAFHANNSSYKLFLDGCSFSNNPLPHRFTKESKLVFGLIAPSIMTACFVLAY